MTRLADSVPRIIQTLLTDTSQTTIFTAEAGTKAVPSGIHIANVSTAAVSVSIHCSESGGTDYALVYQYPVQPNSTGLDVSDEDGLGFRLADGGKVKVTAGANNALHVTLRLIELSKSS